MIKMPNKDSEEGDAVYSLWSSATCSKQNTADKTIPHFHFMADTALHAVYTDISWLMARSTSYVFSAWFLPSTHQSTFHHVFK